MTLIFIGKIERIEQISNENKELKIIIYASDSKIGIIESIHLEESDFDYLNESIGKYIKVDFVLTIWKDQNKQQVVSSFQADRETPFHIYDEKPLG